MFVTENNLMYIMEHILNIYYIAYTIYNYRLLMRSTHDHEDPVRYWLTDAVGGGQPIPDKVFMVMSRPKSKVYYCFIKLSGIFLQKDCDIHHYCFFIAPAAVSSVLYRPNVRSVETNATPLLIGRKQNHTA